MKIIDCYKMLGDDSVGNRTQRPFDFAPQTDTTNSGIDSLTASDSQHKTLTEDSVRYWMRSPRDDLNTEVPSYGAAVRHPDKLKPLTLPE